jgi:two-component system response regulator FixJ
VNQADATVFVVESAGLRVETYASGREFLDACDRSRRGCVLLDVRMPDMDGFAVEARMREARIPLPVIVLTAHADAPTSARASEAGALAFLKKPCDDQILLDTVAQAIALDRDRDDPRPAH